MSVSTKTRAMANEKCLSEVIPLETSFTNKPRQLAIDCEGLIFQYGNRKQRTILNGVDIHVKTGNIYGLLGPSGCGKTTLLRCIIGRLKPTNGTIRIYGKTPGDSSLCIPGRGIGYMPQELALYPEITVKESLEYFGSLYFMKKEILKERINFLLDFLAIKHKNSLVKNLSGGEKRRVSFACALIHQPPLLILDEPTVGVDPLLRHSIWDHLKEMTKKNNMTIIITTHYVEEARKANMVGLMRDGHLLAEMNPEMLIQKFGVPTLEDVFWKLCQKESNMAEIEGQVYPTITCEDSTNYNADANDVWMTHDELRVMQHGVILGQTKSKTHAKKSNYSLINDTETNLEINHSTPSTWTNFTLSFIRMLALIHKSFICLRRNTTYALFQIIVPAVQVIVFCLCVGQEPFDLSFAVVNNEANIFGYSNMFLNTLSNRTFKKEYHENVESAINAVKTGRSWGAISIGPRFSSAITDRFLEGSNVDNQTIHDSTIDLYIDMTNQQIAFTVYAKLVNSFETFGKKMLAQSYQNPSLSEPPIVMKPPIYGDKEPDFSKFLAPGIMIGMVHLMAIGLTLLTIIAEKKEGLLDRCWVAGVSAVEMIIGIMSTLFLTMLGQIALVLILTLLLFDIPVHGSLFWVFICVLLAGTSGMAYGLLLSALCNREAVAILIALASFYPIFLFSGLFWPVEGMEYYLRYFSYCLPLTELGETMRSLMLRGWSITEQGIWLGPAIASGWAIMLLVVSVLVFRFNQTSS